MFYFASPWLFLLLLLPLAVRWLLPAYREQRVAVRVPFMALLGRISGQQGSAQAPVARRRKSQWMLLLITWLALVTALARPRWMDEPIVHELPMRDMLVALDLSGSMETTDFTNQAGQQVDRLTAAREVLDEFIARRDGDRIGLIFFGSAAYVQTPFTADLDVVRELLGEAQVRMLGPRTVLGDAIGQAIPLFERSEVDERVMILLTDGNDTGSLVPPARAAEIAADNGVTIYPIAMGDPEAAGEQALDEEALAAIAKATGGTWFHAEDRQALDAAYRQLDELNPRQVESLSYRPEHDLFHWPLAAALVLILLYHAAAALLHRRQVA